MFIVTEAPTHYWHRTEVLYTNTNSTDVYCEFYQYFTDGIYTPEIYVYINNAKWGLMVSHLDISASLVFIVPNFIHVIYVTKQFVDGEININRRC